MKKLQNFINGKWEAPLSQEYAININPATQAPLCESPLSGSDDVQAAVKAALSAFQAWRKTTPQERSDFLKKIAQGIEARLVEFASIESQDQGKPISLAQKIEIPRVCDNFRFFADLILEEESFSKSFPFGTGTSTTHRQPLGVQALISPWNLPLYLLTWKIAPALACGNTVVCKPSELTPMSAHLLIEVLQEVGLPPGVCNLVLGTGPEAGAPLVQHPDVRGVSFTGGTQTGALIENMSQGKRVSLELGGKNPCIVFEDYDPSHLETIVRSCFQNQGEICLCTSRLLIQESIYEEFKKDFLNQLDRWQPSDPSQKATTMGALVSENHLNKVHGFVTLAQKEGAQVLCGGAPIEGPGFFYPPTVLEGVSPSSRVFQEEIFGPVITLHSFSSEKEALELANGVPYGLACSTWSQDEIKAKNTALQIDAGTQWVNCWMARDLRTPFGGMKNSGKGREGGRYSLDFYSELKSICVGN